MWGTRRRQEIAEHAREAGLGEVGRIHRAHGLPTGLVVLLASIVAVAVVPAAIATIILYTEDSTTWQWVAGAWLLAVGLLFLLVHVVPPRGGRRWYAVITRGVLEWRRGAVRVLTWDELRAEVPRVCNTTDLEQAVVRRRPVGTWTPRRFSGWGVAALVTVFAVWFAGLPLAQHVFAGERPTDLSHFARMCEGGAPMPRTAAYEGAGPHPVAVYYGPGTYPTFTAGETTGDRPEPDAVQLVGCMRLLGKASEELLEVCRYTGGHGWETYQGRYRVDVHEARTGRPVTSFELDGATGDRGECMYSIPVPSNAEPDFDTLHTYPEDDAYAAALKDLVSGLR